MRDYSTYRTMYMNALIGLENGHLMPWDKDMLASAPLPDSVSDPFTTKEMPDVLESMKLTFNAMSIWVDEAKKVNYFSKRFVQLSRMVMNGVTTMGRGLVTLHARGEDLSQSPMSIQDLLGVASYHFRKSYLGVLQTSRSHPEIGERLLMNQIGWNNMLMRLFKTRDKLAEPVVSGQCSGGRKDQGARIQDSGASGREPVVSGQCSGGKDQETRALPDTSDLLVQALRERTHTPDLKSAVSTLAAPSALTEPGAFTAPRAFSSYDSVPKRGLLPKATVPSVGMKNEEGRMKTEEAANKLNEAEIEEKQKNIVNEAENNEEQNNRRNKTKITEEQLIEKNETENKEEPQIKENKQDQIDKIDQKEIKSGRDNESESDSPTAAPSKQPPETHLPTESPVDQTPENDCGDSTFTKLSPAEKLSSPDGDNGTVACRQQSPPSQTDEEPTNPLLESKVRYILSTNPEAWEEMKAEMNDPQYCLKNPEYVKIFRKILKERSDSS